MHTLAKRCIAAAACVGALLADANARCSAEGAVVGTDVTTLAGSGRLGIADGPADRATFLMPVAVAFGKRGELYVADEAAQRIRKIEDGRVTTVAGSGKIDSLGVRVDGGYKDGPALAAQFDDPTAVTISDNGDVYVADSGNHCIRRVSGGVVTTVAGSPERTAKVDGPSTVAGFVYPHALSFDDDGVLYVADFGAGVRRIAKDGSVDSLAGEGQDHRSFVGVSAFGKAPYVTVYATDLDRRYVVFSPATATSQPYDDSNVEGAPGNRELYAIAHVDENQFLATDLRSSAIRIYRLPEKPYVGLASGPLIAGASAEDPSETVGDVDGDYSRARFYDPLGLAILRNTVAIADTGNRKIRAMRLLDTRRSLTPGSKLLTRTSGNYRVLYVGASYNFYATSWEQSIAGLLESRLNAARRQIGLARTVEVETVRLDSSDIGLQEQFVDNYVPRDAFDLIVFGDETYYLIQGAPVGGNDAVRSAGLAMSELQRQFGATKFVVFAYPEYAAESFVDGLIPRELRADQIGSATRVRTAERAREQLREFSQAASPVPVYDALAEFSALDRTLERRQIYPADDSHETLVGREVLADHLYSVLARLAPWRN